MQKLLLDNVEKLLYNQCKDKNVNTYIKLSIMIKFMVNNHIYNYRKE